MFPAFDFRFGPSPTVSILNGVYGPKSCDEPSPNTDHATPTSAVSPLELASFHRPPAVGANATDPAEAALCARVLTVPSGAVAVTVSPAW